MVTQDQLMELRRRKPFVPFRITARDGRSIEVNEPLMFAFNEIMVLVAKEGGGHTTFRQDEIASIDMLTPIS
jgi:hypothetical protein